MSFLVHLDLGYLPEIYQVGLCLHGRKAIESSCLPYLWALHAYRYPGQLEVHGECYPFHEGCISLIPPRTEATWNFPTEAPHYYVHFFLRPSPEKSPPLPLVQSLDQDFIPFCDRLEKMIAMFHENPRYAAIQLWSLLLECASLSNRESIHPFFHPTLQNALTLIRDELRTARLCTISVRLGVSQSHLNNLFKKEFGVTLHDYIHKKRIERALHLLRDSIMKVKSIAFECGYPSLQYFNKVIRKETGFCPSIYREHHHSVGTGEIPKVPP